MPDVHITRHACHPNYLRLLEVRYGVVVLENIHNMHYGIMDAA